MEDTTNLTVKNIDASLVSQVKGAAALDRKSMREWIADALRAALAKPAKKTGRAA